MLLQLFEQHTQKSKSLKSHKSLIDEIVHSTICSYQFPLNLLILHIVNSLLSCGDVKVEWACRKKMKNRRTSEGSMRKRIWTHESSLLCVMKTKQMITMIENVFQQGEQAFDGICGGNLGWKSLSKFQECRDPWTDFHENLRKMRKLPMSMEIWKVYL